MSPTDVVAPEPFEAGPLTDEKFDRWLDARPGRRAEHERNDTVKRAETRARVARLFALRTADIIPYLQRVVELVAELRDTMRGFTRRFAPLEAVRVLESFGLPVPDDDDICQDWRGDTFENPHRDCRRLAKLLTQFVDDHESTVNLLAPPSEGRDTA